MRNTTIAIRSGLLALCLVAEVGQAQFLECTVPVGPGPLNVLWNPMSNKVYVSHPEAGLISIIDGASNVVIGTVLIPTGGYELCWNSVENKVYCTPSDPDWLVVIDGVGDTLLRKVRMRGIPAQMAYNATMNKLYVARMEDHMVSVYDGRADTLVAEVWLGAGNTPFTLMWHPVSNRLLCATWGNADSVLVINCNVDVVVERLDVGNNPYAMCRNRANDLQYVCADGGIRVLTAAGDSILDIIAADAGDMCFAPYPNKIYAVTTNQTYVIDCEQQAVTDSLPYVGYATVCDTVHGKVYNAARPNVFVLDARGDSLLTTIPVGSSPEAICWNRTNSRVYIADYSGQLYVIRDTSVALAEPAPGATMRGSQAATIARGILTMDGAGPAVLLDMAGRLRMSLHAGDNDVSMLARGVYFLKPDGQRQVIKILVP
jgi:DNA-binding beta-propeller fold protein YncE